MKHLMKAVFGVAIIMGLIFAYVSQQQARHNAEIKTQQLQSDRDINEFNEEFARKEHDQAAANKYDARAKEADEKLKKAGKELQEAEGVTQKSQKEINQALEEYDKEHKSN